MADLSDLDRHAKSICKVKEAPIGERQWGKRRAKWRKRAISEDNGGRICVSLEFLSGAGDRKKVRLFAKGFLTA